MRIRDILFEFAPSGGGDSGNYFQALASAWYNGTFDTGSLQKGIKSQEDVERLLNRGIVCPDGKTRKLHIDYNANFDGVEIYSDDYYEYGDHDDTIDSRTGQKWGPYDFMAFSDEDLSEGLNEFVTPQAVAQDPGLEREKDVDVIFFGKMPRDYAAETAWAALEEVLPAEYPAGSEKAQEKVYEVNQNGGAVVTTKPLSVAKKLVATFTGYGIKSRINGNLNEFAADDGDSGEDDALRKYARMWWNGDDATQQQIERALAKMGWEIGEDEGGYDNGGVFVVRAGDVNGRSYESWAAEDLTEGSLEEVDRRGFLKGVGATAVAGGAGYVSGVRKVQNTTLARVLGKLNGFLKPLKASKVKDKWSYELITRTQELIQKYKIDSDIYNDDLYSFGENQGERAYSMAFRNGIQTSQDREKYEAMLFELSADLMNATSFHGKYINKESVNQGVAEGELDEKSTSQAQFRTMAAAAHDPKFAKKVGIKPSVAREFNRADTGQDYKSLPKKATEGATVTTTPGSIEPGGAVDNFKQQMANNTERGMAEGNRKSEPPEADYSDDYQDMVKRVKKLAGLGPLKTQYDPNKRVYRNMPTAVQPRK
jgi:hypothetical protein